MRSAVWRQSGKTLRGIAAVLNHRGYRTRRGSAWRLEHVARIVKQSAHQRTSHPPIRVTRGRQVERDPPLPSS
jgi:hypothetical protein